MAVKMINENGKVTVKTAKQVKTERTVRKVQKYITVAITVMMVLSMSSVMVFATGATGDNSAPANVQTSTMSGLSDIIWWLVRVAVLAIGGIPAVIKIVQGQADENPRDRNAGIATLVITAAVFGATFAIQALIGI